MATNYKYNDFARLIQEVNVAEQAEGVLPDPGPTPELSSSERSFQAARYMLYNLDLRFHFDTLEPADDFTDRLMGRFLTTYRAFQTVAHQIDMIPIGHERPMLMLDYMTRSAMTLGREFAEAEFGGLLKFIVDSDTDDWFENCEPDVTDSPQSPDPPEDLTEEGIEPNPGPGPGNARHNRSSALPHLTKAQRKKIKEEQKAFDRCLQRSIDNKIKYSQFLADNENIAQIGGTLLNDDVPPRECSRCGKTKCECLIKQDDDDATDAGLCSNVTPTQAVATGAVALTVVASIVKMIEAVSELVNRNVAQVGVMSWFMSEKTNSLVDNLNERLEALPDAETLHGVIRDKMEEILSSDCGMIPISVRTILKALLTLAAIFTLIQLGIITYRIASLIAGIALAGITGLSDMMAHFQTWSEKTEVNKAQIGLPKTEGEMIGVLANILPKSIAFFFSTVVVYLVSKIPGRDNTPEGWMRKVSMFPRVCTSMGEIFKYTSETISKAWSYFQVSVLGCDPDLINDAVPEISTWMVQVEMYMTPSNLEEACKVKQRRMKIARLYQEGHALLIKYHDALTPEYKLAMQRMMTQAAKIKSYVEGKYPEFKAIRNVPLPIWLVGESQIGKSRLQSLIATELCLSAGLEDCKDQIYQRCVEQEYWDGYNNQFVVIFDDFGQMKDTVSSPNLEFFEIIRSVGPFPYPLHMADIAAKSSTMFTSGVIMASTNKLNMGIESLTYPDAVWNRLNAQAWGVLVKEEYAIMRLDNNGREYATLNLEAVRRDSPRLENGNIWEINPYIYDFVRFDARHRDYRAIEHGERVGWDVFIQALKDDLHRREGGGASLDSFLDDYISEKKNVAQIGAAEIKSVFVAQGPSDGIVDPHDLGHMLDWLTNYREMGDPEGSWMLNRQYSAAERACYDGDPYKQSLLAYTPECIPDDYWAILLIGYYKHETSIGKRITAKLKFCADILGYQLGRVPEKVREFCASFKAFCAKVCKAVHDFMRSEIGKIVMVVGAGFLLAFIRTAFTIDGLVAGYKENSATQEVAESDTRNLQPRLRAHAKTIAKAKPKLVKAEMGQSMGQLDVIAKIRRQQYLMMGVYDSDEVRVFGTITNIVGQIFLMPGHFYTYFQHKEPKEIRLVHCDSTKVEIRKPFKEFFGSIVALDGEDGNDAIVFSIPNFIRGKNITSHFISKDEISKLYDRKVYVTLSGLDYEKNGNTVVSTSVTGQADLLVDKVHNYVLETQGNPIPVTACSVAAYTMPTKSGDCGKILSANSDSLTGRVLGIHVSGSVSGFNFAQIVLREDLIEAMALFPATAQCARGMNNVIENAGEPLDTGVIHLGRLPDHLPQSSKTTIIPSRMHGMLSIPITRPALLKPVTMVKEGQSVYWDPLVEGAKKAGRTCGFAPPHILDAAARDVLNICRTQFREDPPNIRIMEYEEAIKGIEGDDMFQPINRTTSPGYPYMTQVKKRSQKGKTNWMGREEWEMDTEEAKQLRSDVLQLIDDAENSKPLDVIWVDTLKDERRTLAKVEQGNTRVISNGPMHFNIAFRMYFMAALAFIRHNRIYNGVAVGINVWDREWDHLAKYLQANSKRFIDGDFKNFDGTLMDQFMWKIFWILDSMYDDDNHTIRYNLWYCVVYAIRTCRGSVYQCTHSLPSGFVATAEVNSLFVNLVFRCAYLQMAAEKCPEECSMRSFNENVRLIAYGDDNVMSITPKILRWFNMETLVVAMRAFGMEYTAADKSDIIVNNKTLDDVSFLKRGFKKVDSLYGDTSVFLCPADLDTRLEMLNWTRKRAFCSNPEESDSVSEVIKEIAMHGKKIYDEYVPRIVNAARDAGVIGFKDEGLYHYHHQIIAGTKIV